MSTSAASSQPDCVLLNVHAHLGQRRNATTASSTTRNHEKIEVTLCAAPPPLPSNLFVHCPELSLTVRPRVVRAVEDLFLLRVAIDCHPDGISSPQESDYFIYRAGRAGTEREPLLVRLPRPNPFVHDDDVGLLSRGRKFTVAVLVFTGTHDVYDLRMFHSENRSRWIYRKVSMTEPQRRPPLLIPENCCRLPWQETSTVISIGGEAGTIGWVDLWHGIILCDVLRDEPMLRVVPMPVPLYMICRDRGRGTELGCPKPFRGIAYVKAGGDNPHGYLKLVHVEANATPVRGGELDDETKPPSFQMDRWVITTYTNTAMTSNRMDWHMEPAVNASDITMNTQTKSELLQYGLLGSVRKGLVSYPAPDVCAAHGCVVYLIARKKYQHPKAWVLALDTKKKKLLGLSEFDIERQPDTPVMYCPSGIAKYINPEPETGDTRQKMMRIRLFGVAELY